MKRHPDHSANDPCDPNPASSRSPIPGPPHTEEAPLATAELSLPRLHSGKVRDLFALPPGPGKTPRLLIVATDRISAFDVVLPTLIPGKGRVLTELAAFWLRWLERRRITKTHLITTDPTAIPPAAFEGDTSQPHELVGRLTIGRACKVIPVECVVRGYLEGSGYREYQEAGRICGVELPAGLRRGDRLPQPIFTPATKADQGAHDQNVTFEQAESIIEPAFGPGVAEYLRKTSINAYTAAHEHARERGLILADTKFEFGIPLVSSDDPNGTPDPDALPILVDEALTPDSSRYWPEDEHHARCPNIEPPPSYDKQFVREYLQSLVHEGTWNKKPPGPHLPDSVVTQTQTRYRTALALLLGEAPRAEA